MNDMHADAQRGFPNSQPTSCKEQKNAEKRIMSSELQLDHNK